MFKLPNSNVGETTVLIVKETEIKLSKAVYEGLFCGNVFEIPQYSLGIIYPKFCVNKLCKAKSSFDSKFKESSSEFYDFQFIVVKEARLDKSKKFKAALS